MSERFRNNLIATLIVFALLAIIVLTSGCMTTYSIEKRASDGSSITVHVRSYREFQQPEVHYNKTTDTVTFNFGAESATNAVSPIEQAFADVITSGGSIAATVVKPVLAPGPGQ